MRRAQVAFIAKLICCWVVAIGAGVGVFLLIRSPYGDGLMFTVTGYVAVSLFMILTQRFWDRFE